MRACGFRLVSFSVVAKIPKWQEAKLWIFQSFYRIPKTLWETRCLNFTTKSSFVLLILVYIRENGRLSEPALSFYVRSCFMKSGKSVISIVARTLYVRVNISSSTTVGLLKSTSKVIWLFFECNARHYFRYS